MMKLTKSQKCNNHWKVNASVGWVRHYFRQNVSQTLFLLLIFFFWWKHHQILSVVFFSLLGTIVIELLRKSHFLLLFLLMKDETNVRHQNVIKTQYRGSSKKEDFFGLSGKILVFVQENVWANYWKKGKKNDWK